MRRVSYPGCHLHGMDLSDTDLMNADLMNADLMNANLISANLRSAGLIGANLSFANLSNANLSNADLRGANLSNANLSNANLRSADLSNANLSNANLRSADLSGANLPSPTMLLLANWGELSDITTAILMLYDASAHPIGRKVFDDWAYGGFCPYNNIKFQRAANFRESEGVWKSLCVGNKVRYPTTWEACRQVLNECCKW